MSTKQRVFFTGVICSLLITQFLYSQENSSLILNDKSGTIRVSILAQELNGSGFIQISTGGSGSISPVNIYRDGEAVWFRFIKEGDEFNSDLPENQVEVIKKGNGFLFNSLLVKGVIGQLTFECVLSGEIHPNSLVSVYSLDNKAAEAEKIIKSIEIKIQE